MSQLKAWIAKRNVNIHLLIDNHIKDITFTITNSDGTAYVFTGYTEITLTIYEGSTEDRVAKATHTYNGGAGELSEDTGVITWNAVYPTALLIGHKYFYELEWTNASAEDIRLAEGDMIIEKP